MLVNGCCSQRWPASKNCYSTCDPQSSAHAYFDEATSALDYLTERTVCENLRRELSGDTVFFITHGLATIRSADKIMLMENGLLQEIGTHQQLLARKGLYYALYRRDTSITRSNLEKLSSIFQAVA